MSQNVKINSQEFKDQIDNFSKENRISKRKTRKKVFWQIVESRKKQNDLQKKKTKKIMSEKVKTMSTSSSVNKKNSALSKKHLSQLTSQNNFSKTKNQETKFLSQNHGQTSNKRSFQIHNLLRSFILLIKQGFPMMVFQNHFNHRLTHHLFNIEVLHYNILSQRLKLKNMINFI